MTIDEKEISEVVKWDDLFNFFRTYAFAVIYYKDKTGWNKLKLTMEEYWDPDRIKKGCEKGVFFKRRNLPFQGFDILDKIHKNIKLK